MKAKIILYCFFSTVVLVHCVNSDSLSGKVLFGYQGWFDTPSSGSGRGWVHWSSGTPNPDSCTFDLWPDVSEFNESALDWSTELYDINGNSMPLYASNSVDVQDVHFRWMRDYGIDGVVIQRFVSELSSPTMKAFRDSILTNALVAAEKYGVVVSLMYDISGASAEDWDDIIFEDWNYLTGNLSMTASSSYLNHNELPVLFVWGLGFNDREATAEDSLAFVNNMKNETYFIGGVPTYWRTCDGDSLPGFEDVYGKSFYFPGIFLSQNCFNDIICFLLFLKLQWMLLRLGWLEDSEALMNLTIFCKMLLWTTQFSLHLVDRVMHPTFGQDFPGITCRRTTPTTILLLIKFQEMAATFGNINLMDLSEVAWQMVHLFLYMVQCLMNLMNQLQWLRLPRTRSHCRNKDSSCIYQLMEQNFQVISI